jgi:divalent metal cation (Fe/Co/Zn/Cd) transporter
MEPSLLEGLAPDRQTVRRVETMLRKLAAAEKPLSDLHNIRIRANSAGLYVHYHCRFAPEKTIAEVHIISDRIEVALMAALPAVKRVVAHAEPVGEKPHRL